MPSRKIENTVEMQLLRDHIAEHGPIRLAQVSITGNKRGYGMYFCVERYQVTAMTSGSLRVVRTSKGGKDRRSLSKADDALREVCETEGRIPFDVFGVRAGILSDVMAAYVLERVFVIART